MFPDFFLNCREKPAGEYFVNDSEGGKDGGGSTPLLSPSPPLRPKSGLQFTPKAASFPMFLKDLVQDIPLKGIFNKTQLAAMKTSYNRVEKYFGIPCKTFWD